MASKEPLKADERQKILEARLKSIGASPKSLIRGEQISGKFSHFISTGQTEVDLALGDLPGIACGSIVEFVGESSSGKSYLAMKLAAESHKVGKRVAWLNVENSFYAPRAQALGVDVFNANLFELYDAIGPGERWGELAKALLESGDYALIVVDSVTAMIPTADYDKSLDNEAKIGAHARMCGRLVQKLVEISPNVETIVVFINQFRYGAGAMPGTLVKKSSGGEAIGFFAHTRLVFSKVNGVAGEVYNSAKEIIGGKSRVFLLKNRFGPPLVKVDFPIYFSPQESDPVIEFIMRAKSKQYELITEVRKVLKFITHEGEVIESKNPKEFIQLLQKTPFIPSKKSKGDTSNTAFEHICFKMKFSDVMIDKLNAKLNAPDDAEQIYVQDSEVSLSDLSVEEVANIMNVEKEDIILE